MTALQVGDLVRWRPDIHKNGLTHRVTELWPHDKMVTLDHKGRVSCGLLEVVERAVSASEADAELMEVIDAQMDEIDWLVAEATERDAMAANDEGWEKLDVATDLIGQLCIALGFDRRPQQPTGIPELDALVRYMMD